MIQSRKKKHINDIVNINAMIDNWQHRK